MATLLIALGLASKEPGQKGIATDVFIMSVADGRLDLHLLAAHMAKLMPSGYVIISRWTKTLADAATVSKQHTKAVCQIIQGALRHDPENPPRDLGGLLELLYESQLTLGGPITDPEAIHYLSRLTKGGKIKSYANKLLKL